MEERGELRGCAWEAPCPRRVPSYGGRDVAEDGGERVEELRELLVVRRLLREEVGEEGGARLAHRGVVELEEVDELLAELLERGEMCG